MQWSPPCEYLKNQDMPRSNKSRSASSSEITRSLTTQEHLISHSGLNPNALAYDSTTPAATLWVNSVQTVMLQTAQAQVFNHEHPQTSQQTCIVLDSGSQCSYVPERITKELDLPSQGRQMMRIVTFGVQGDQPQPCELVKLGVTLKDGDMICLSLLTVPFICEPLTRQPVSLCQEQFGHLTGLDLADSSSDTNRCAYWM